MKTFTAVVEKCAETGLYRGRDISPILIRRIADEIGVPVEDFLSKR